MINFTSKPRYALDDLIRLVHALRAPGGCPWDAAQTHLSIRRNFLEEAYEALDCDDAAMLREELGDVLLQVLFHADIEADRGRMTIDDIADAECRKLIFRHPFLFGGENASWDELKQQEKHRKSVLEGISRVQGALPRAAKVVSRISKSPNADRLFAAFDEPAAADAQRDDVHPQAANQSESSGDNSAEREKADAYADEILAVVRKARVDGIDIESALRNRLRDVEEKVALIESEINND